VIEVVLGIALALIIFLVWFEINILPVIFLGGLFFLLYRMTSGKMPNLNNSIGKTARPSSSIQFEEIGGQEVAKKELLEALDFIKSPDRIKEMGIRPLKGILMIGPPGTGKTLLAKAAANYTNSVFISTSGSEFVEMYAGVGAQRVRQLFQQCRQKTKNEKKNGAVLFIDEIDILGSKRGSNSSHMEYDQTLNQLLTEMDGIGNKDDINILVMGATNRPESLDRALVRPGRFDRVIQVELPDREGRLEILKLHTKNKPLDHDVDLDKISREAYGFSGAQLESLSNEAAIMAMRENKKVLSLKHFMEAIDKVMMGEKQDKKPDKGELKRIAVHECGHAVVGEVLKPNSVSVVTITPRGKSLGYIRQQPEKDYLLYTKDYLETQICILMGGTVSEKLVLGEQSTGSSNDFNQSVELAKKIIDAGLSPLGVVSVDHLSGEVIQKNVQDIISEQEKRATRIIKSNLSLIKKGAEELLKEERMSGEFIRKHLKKKGSFWPGKWWRKKAAGSR